MSTALLIHRLISRHNFNTEAYSLSWYVLLSPVGDLHLSDSLTVFYRLNWPSFKGLIQVRSSLQMKCFQDYLNRTFRGEMWNHWMMTVVDDV